MSKNPTLTQNMKNVKWSQIPPVKCLDPRRLIKASKQSKPFKLEKIHGNSR